MNVVTGVTVNVNRQRPAAALAARVTLYLCIVLSQVAGAGTAGDQLEGQWRRIGDDGDNIRERVIEQLIYVDRSNMRVIETRSGAQAIGARTVRPDSERVERLMTLLDGIVPLSPLERIEIDGQRITLTYADGRVRHLCAECAEGVANVQSTAREGPQKLVLAALEGESLTIETNTNAGLSVLEVYKRDNKYLRVEFTIDASSFPEPVHASYEYAPAGMRAGAD